MIGCPICNSETVRNLEGVSDAVTGEFFDVRYCSKCEIGVTEPQPANISPYYTNYYGGRHGASVGYRAKRRFALMDSSLGSATETKRVLDIGCGEGEFLNLAGQNGWQSVGIERSGAPQPEIEIYPDIKGVKEKYGPDSFDAVTLWHSLEHLRHPGTVLRDAYKLLNANGRLLLAVPDAFGIQARFFGVNWLHLDCPRHLFHFGEKGLVKMMLANGFQIESIRHMEFEYDLLGISQSALNTISSTQNVFFNKLTNKPVSVGKLPAAAHLVGGIVLSAAALPFAALGALLKKGGTIVVVASKNSESNN